jgi:uncharacterized surface protein with fasciclin (FAS1) repeats
MSILKFFSALVLFLLFSSHIVAQQTIANTISLDLEKSIVKYAKESGNHNLLLAGIKASDLETILDTQGPFTVFTPNDVNFDTNTKQKVIELVGVDNEEELQSVIGYHIIAGNLSASKILIALCRGQGKATFTTITGDKLVATMSGLDIILTDNHGNQSVITKADFKQSNGVIHEIDSISKPIKA